MSTAIGTSVAKQSRRSVRSLSVQEKVHAIDRVHEGESKASVARDIGVPESTLRGWCKGEEKLRGIVARSSGGNSSSNETVPSSVDDSLEKTPKLNQSDGLTGNGLANSKRDFSVLDDLHQSGTLKKFAKGDATGDVPTSEVKVSNQRRTDSPINFSKSIENDSSSRSSFATTNSFIHKEEVRESQPAAAPTLPALAAIASAITGKNQLLYNAYTNGMLNAKQELNNKPLDYSTKVSSRMPRPDVNEALMYWLRAQREQATLPMSPMEARTADTSSWFWKLYKNYGVLPQVRR